MTVEQTNRPSRVTVVALPKPAGHACRIGWEVESRPDGTEYYRPSEAARFAAGTVVECECGKTYVAYRPYSNVFVNSWKPEGRLARWLRERRERKEITA